jgi:thiamine-phosphate diphosphorylase
MAAAAPDATVDLFAISPGRGDGDELARKLPLLAEGGLRRFLLREKELPPERRLALAQRLAPLCRELGVELWIAEDAALARSVGAAGVHLSERSPAPSQIAREFGDALALGVSLHEAPSRDAAELALCRHAFLAPVFSTPSKPAERTLGADGFACRAAGLSAERGLPVYALGGIGQDHLPLLARRGVTRVAAIRLFFDAADPRRAVEAARAALRRP